MIVADAEGLGDFETQWGPFLAAEHEGEAFVGRAKVKLPPSVLAQAMLPKGLRRMGPARLPVLPGRAGRRFAAAMPKPGLPKPKADEMATPAVVTTAPVAKPSGLADLWAKVRSQPAWTAGAVVVGLVLLKALSK